MLRTDYNNNIIIIIRFHHSISLCLVACALCILVRASHSIAENVTDLLICLATSAEVDANIFVLLVRNR